jgi:NADH-quinone oxidoreductase subunit J
MTALSSPVLLHLLGAFLAGTCILVVSAQNPVHSLLLLIIVFVIGTLLLFTLQIEYFAILFLIVYVGAIVVLFLFVIIRLEIKIINVAIRFRDLFSYRHFARALLIFEAFLFFTSDTFDLTGFTSNVSVASFVESNSYVD